MNIRLPHRLKLLPNMRLATMAAAVLLAPVAATADAASLLAPTSSGDDNYNEHFTFVGDLVDGGYLWIQLTVTNLGPGSGNASCRVVAVRPGMPPWTVSQRFGSGEWSHDAATDTLNMGNCSAKLGAQPVVKANLGGGRAELRFAGAATPSSPHPAITIGNYRHATSWLLPFASATALLQLPGRELVTANAGGYGETTRSNVPPRTLAKRWIRFRATRGNTKVILLARQDLDGRLQPAWIAAQGKPAVRFDQLQLQRGGTKAAPTWKIDLSSGGKSTQILSTSLLVRSAPMEEFNRFVAAVMRPIVGSPVTFVHRATLQIGGEAPTHGILEILEDDQ